MSGHDNLDSGHDQQWWSVDGPRPNQPWTETSWEDFVQLPSDDAETFDFMDGSMDTDHDNTLPSVLVQEDPTLDDQTLNGAGSVNVNANQSRFPDLPMFESPHDQTFGAEEISYMPPVNTNQANGQEIHTALPDQTFNANPMSNTSPAHYGFNSYNVQGLKNNLTWGPTGADWQHQYPSTNNPGEYPVPPQQQWPGLHRTLFQLNDYAMAGAGAIDPRCSFQVYATGNHGSLDASHGLEHMTAPPVLRKLAPKPSPDVVATAPMTQDSKDDAKPVPPPVAPKVKEPKVKETAQKKKPTTSNAKKPAVKSTLYEGRLRVSSLEAARKIVEINRIVLKVVDDDCEDVVARREHFVTSIVKALDVDFRPQAEGHEKLTKEGRDEFTRWQQEHENKVWALLTQEEIKDASEYAQACATILYHMILEAHQSRFIAHPGKAIANGSVDDTMKCSERINAAITAIEEYSIVKYDFLRQERLEALLASPRGFCSRKIENMWVNYKKKEDAGPVREADGTDSTAAPKSKSQGKRKRKTPLPSANDDEVEGQSDEESVQPTKRTKCARRN